MGLRVTTFHTRANSVDHDAPRAITRVFDTVPHDYGPKQNKRCTRSLHPAGQRVFHSTLHIEALLKPL